MSTAARSITAEELFRMPGDQRRELVKGELRTMAPAGFEHGAIIINIAWRLADYVKRNDLGVVLGAETGYVLRRNPDTVRGADVSFVAIARIPAKRLPQKFWEGAPDLAVEVMSPEDTANELGEKVGEYLSAGARLVWVVNPKRRTVTVHRPGSEPRILRGSD